MIWIGVLTRVFGSAPNLSKISTQALSSFIMAMCNGVIPEDMITLVNYHHGEKYLNLTKIVKSIEFVFGIYTVH